MARDVERVSVQAAQRTIRRVQFRLAYRTTKLLENLAGNASSITAERRLCHRKARIGNETTGETAGKEGAMEMATGYCRTRRNERYRDLEELVDYREYDGEWTCWFEEHWLKPRLQDLGYAHVRFYGGKICEYDGSYRARVCELKKPGRQVERYVYG